MKLTTLLAGVALTAFGATAQAVTIEFNSPGFSDGTGGSYASIYEQDGYVFSTPQSTGMHFHMGQLAVDDPAGSLPGWLGFHNNIGDNSILNTVTVERSDMSAFDFVSFDILSTFASAMWTSSSNRWHNPETTITSSNGDVLVIPASTWQSGDPDTADQTIFVGWSNVTWVTFVTDGNSSSSAGEIMMMDNVVLNAVPVPAAIWMFAGALLALGRLKRAG